MTVRNVQVLQKRGVRAPVPDEIEVGEVAINTAAGKLYVKTDGGDVVSVGAGEDKGGSAVTISETAPADPSKGDEWFCSEEGASALYIFDGDVWFGATVPSLIATEYAIDALTRSGSVILNLTEDDALSVKTRSGSIEWNMEGDELIGDARTGEINLPLQEQ